MPKPNGSQNKVTEESSEDKPLFIDVELIKRDEETGGWTSDVHPLKSKPS